MLMKRGNEKSAHLIPDIQLCPRKVVQQQSSRNFHTTSVSVSDSFFVVCIVSVVSVVEVQKMHIINYLCHNLMYFVQTLNTS